MSKVAIVPYDPVYEPKIQRLFNIPVAGNIGIALTRQPEYLTGAFVQCEQPEIWLAVSAGRAVAVCNFGRRRLWVDGKVNWVRYMCDLRIDPAFQGSNILLRLTAKFNEICAHDTLPAQTIVFADNELMLQLIRKREEKPTLKYFPYYHEAGNYSSHFIATKNYSAAPLPPGYLIKSAAEMDLGKLQAFWDKHASVRPYYPYYSFIDYHMPYYKGFDLDRLYVLQYNTEIKAIAGIADTSAYKQTVITSYSKLYGLLRPAYNLIAQLSNGFVLPPAGSRLEYRYVHSILVANDEAASFELLLNYMCQKHQTDTPYLLCGLSDMNPLAGVFKKRRPAYRMQGKYYLVTPDNNPPGGYIARDFYLEAARI